MDSQSNDSNMQSLVFDFSQVHLKVPEPESSLLADDTSKSKFSVFANHNGLQHHHFTGAFNVTKTGYEPTMFINL